MTRIRTFSKNPIYIPNSIFASIPIETPSRMTNRRINEVVGIGSVVSEEKIFFKFHPPLFLF
jgi:small-conductance mechanosensitive channel